MELRDLDLVELQRRAALGTMCAGLAHEVHAPLDCAVAAVRRALDGVREGGSPVVALELVERELAKALEGLSLGRSVLREALTLAAPADVVGHSDLSAGVRATLALAETQRPMMVRVEERLAPGLRIRGDGTHVRQITLNLLLNAFRALDGVDGAHRVLVQTGPSGRGMAELLVQDDGPGIPEEIKARLFQPFAASRASGDGVGLGLHVVRRIAGLLGGTADVFSVPDHGTTVRVALPLAAGERAG